MTIDATTFRHVLGHVPTAVVLLTILDEQGVDRGMTVGSFCSLSLSPPLVLACIGNDATIASAMRGATQFGISALADDQEALSRRFADTEARGFDGVRYHRGPNGLALFDDAAAYLECRITARHPGGDHTMVVGEVLFAQATLRSPLIYHRSGYARLAK